MKKILFICLVALSIVFSSNVFSAVPQGKFPIQIVSSRSNPNEYEKEIIQRTEMLLEKTQKFRITQNEEDRLVLQILISDYIPSVVSTDPFAFARRVEAYTLVWLAKPKNKLPYFLWHDIGWLHYTITPEYIVSQAEFQVDKIKNRYPYIFN
ncbi:MAG TPA: hypothetical protein PL004_08095 [Bacillota bacterium]|nr:hypothetical protein [Bacillota bacterium]